MLKYCMSGVLGLKFPVFLSNNIKSGFESWQMCWPPFCTVKFIQILYRIFFFGNVGRGMETLQKYRLFLIIALESSTKINLFSPTYLSHIKCPIHHNKQTHHMFCAKYPQGQLFVYCSKKGTELRLKNYIREYRTFSLSLNWQQPSLYWGSLL